MKLGDNTLNNERLSLVMTKLPTKKLMNCSPYFTTLQNINNLEAKRSITYKRKVNVKNPVFFKKNLSSGLKIIRQFVKENHNVYKTANKSASIHTNQILLCSNRL